MEEFDPSPKGDETRTCILHVPNVNICVHVLCMCVCMYTFMHRCTLHVMCNTVS